MLEVERSKVKFLVRVQISVNLKGVGVAVFIIVILQSFLGLLDPHLVLNVLVIESVE
jgi:hypothetical protein